MKRTLTGLLLGAGFLLPTCLLAQPPHDDRRDHPDEHRYYDSNHKDYHEWNDHEARAYRMYWQQHHGHYVDWNHASAHQRDDYWKWRHSHSDAIVKIDIR